MKKIVSTCLILILLALFGANFYCSRKTEAAYRTLVEKLRQSYVGILQVDLEDYRSGLFLSQARLNLAFSAGGSISLRQQIRHFPWGIKMVTRLSAGSQLATELARLVPLEQLELVTEVDLSGRSHSTLELPELKMTEGPDRLTFGQLDFSCDLDSSLQNGQFLFNLADLKIERAAQQQLALGGVSLQIRFAEPQELPFSDGELGIARVQLNNGDQTLMELSGFHSRSLFQLEGDFLAGSSDLSLPELVLAGEHFRRGVLKLSLRGIDLAAVRELRENLKQLQADLLSRKVDPLVLQVQLIGLCRQLVHNGIELQLEQLALQTAEGSLQGKGWLKLGELGFSTGSGLNPEQVDAYFHLDIDSAAFAAGVRLLDKLKHQGRASDRPAVFNELAEQLAGGLVQKGMLTRSPAGYRLELSIEQGQGLLNGQPFKR